MHIVTPTWRFPDPTEPFVVQKILGLVERGATCTVAREEPHLSDNASLAPLRARGVSVVGPFVPDGKADLVHFEHAGLARMYRRHLSQIRVPKVVTCHGADVLVETLGEDWLEQDFADLFHAVDRIHVVSEELVERCLRLGARPDQLYVAPVGVNLSIFRASSRPPRPSGLALRIVSVGRLHWIKGYEYALQAMRQLLDDGVRVQYTIVGLDEGAEMSMRLAMRDLDLSGVVDLRGSLSPEGVRDVLAASDVFLMSSVTEGASIATCEAMAMGLPSVVTDVGETAKIVRDGVHGFVVPPRSPEAIAAGIAKLRSPELRARMGAKAAADAREFDSAHQIDRLFDLYSDLTAPLPVAHVSSDEEIVSVVIVAHNAASTLDDQLRALEHQRFEGPWEVVVVDNGSRDKTAAIARSWLRRLPGLRVVDAPVVHSIPYARNVGVRAARGSRIVMCDADDVVAPGWLAALAKALEHDAVVIGPLETSQLRPPQFPAPPVDESELEQAEGYGRRVVTANLGFRREVFDRLNGFDEGLPRGEDIDFGWRAIEAGFEPRVVPDAVVHYRSPWRGRALFGQGFVDGEAWPALYVRHREGGLQPPSPAEVRERYRHLARGLADDVWSSAKRGNWWYEVGFCLGRFVGSARSGVRYL
jgi:glycosyltransferase involved in cell wall biosynthesis